MGALKDRLRRAEKVLRIGDPDAELEKMTDQELEDRIHELTAILQREADARGITLADLEMDARNMGDGLPAIEWKTP